jgi:predicted nucleic acid-binding Zn ribbon protein
MNSEVHPVVAGVVLLLAAVAIALWAWASGVAASLGGPAGLHTNPDGHHFIEIQHYLVEHDAQGAYLRTHDLEKIDVEVVLGGYTFFSDGDLLLRRGPDPRSFLDNVRAYGRKTNRNSVVPDEPGSGLFRCSLETNECDRFGEEGVDFKAAFGVTVDWETDEVYVSDTTRHLLRKYSSDGTALAAPVGGFKFPNQLLLHDGQLLVADTNNHVVRILEPQTSGFGEIRDSKSVVPKVAKTAGQRWPSHFTRIGDEWWVNNMRTGMNEGGIYVFDADWQYVRRIGLPANADPISLLPVGDVVWVSDWNNDVIRRFSATGEPLSDLKSAGLEQILVKARTERRSYTMLSYAGVALVVVLLLALMVRAFAVGMNKGPSRQPAGDTSVAAHDLAAPLQLEPDPRVRRRMSLLLKFIMALTVVAVVLSCFLFSSIGNPEVVLPLAAAVAGLVAIVLLVAWVNRANWGTSIEVSANSLTLRDYTGRKSSCSLREARYDNSAIATRDAVVILGRPQAQIYKREDVLEKLIPRLADAQQVGAIGMLKIQIALKHPQGLVTVIAIIGVAVYAAVTLVA